ncbi:UDP-N-acetylglucosamine 2-epimerase [Prevotella nigrescens]
MKKYKVAFATGSRADYGIVRNYISKLNQDPEINFYIIATGALLSADFGSAVDIIKKDGFCIDFADAIALKMETIDDTCHIMAKTLSDFSTYFSSNRPDLLIILGDRYEIFSISIAAAMHRIPILHLHGGELTIANYDEFIRHSITKMSTWHFTSTLDYRKRVIQLGENPKNVYYLGALGAENSLHINMNNVPGEIINNNFSFVVLFHPETLNENSPLEQINEVLKGIEPFVSKYKFAFIGANADTHANQITKRVKDFCNNYETCVFFYNLHPDAYHYLVKKSMALIGNSSSGIIEAPTLGSYTINVGERQTGRVKSKSILNVNCSSKEIIKAIEFIVIHKDEKITNTPYYKKDSANLYYLTTIKILHEERPKYKCFYDINPMNI